MHSINHTMLWLEAGTDARLTRRRARSFTAISYTMAFYTLRILPSFGNSNHSQLKGLQHLTVPAGDSCPASQRMNVWCSSHTDKATCWTVSVPLGIGCLSENFFGRKDILIYGWWGLQRRPILPRGRIETSILDTILNSVLHFPSITTFGTIPFLCLEFSVRSFTVQ